MVKGMASHKQLSCCKVCGSPFAGAKGVLRSDRAMNVCVDCMRKDRREYFRGYRHGQRKQPKTNTREAIHRALRSQASFTRGILTLSWLQRGEHHWENLLKVYLDEGPDPSAQVLTDDDVDVLVEWLQNRPRRRKKRGLGVEDRE